MRSRLRAILAMIAFTLMASNISAATAASEGAEKEAILALVARMEAAWNRGDFRGYMEGFANPDVVFVSRGEFQKDWQGTLDHYIRDYGTPTRRAAFCISPTFASRCWRRMRRSSSAASGSIGRRIRWTGSARA
jgi:hypothetical protein